MKQKVRPNAASPGLEATAPLGLTEVIALSVGWQHSLVVAKLAPTITLSPQTQTAEAGSTISLRAAVDSVLPLNYQWFLNGTNTLIGASKPFLILTNISPSQSGAFYDLVVTNRHGSVTNDPALLSVIPSVPRKTIAALQATSDPGSI